MKYLNFEGLQYFYSKLSSSLASQYVSQSNLKTINGQSLIGTGDITIEGGASGDYLPLSGGTLTGSLNITGFPQLQLIGGTGLFSIKDTENHTLASIYTFNDHSPVNDKTSGIIYCKNDDDSAESNLSPGQLTLTNSGESIYVRPSGIEKSGGSPTEVFATDGSVVDMNTYGLGDSKDYLQDFKDADILMGDLSLLMSIKKVINITDKVAIYAFIFKGSSNRIQLSLSGNKDDYVIGSVGEFHDDGTRAILVPFGTNFENIYTGSSSQIWILAD